MKHHLPRLLASLSTAAIALAWTPAARAQELTGAVPATARSSTPEAPLSVLARPAASSREEESPEAAEEGQPAVEGAGETTAGEAEGSEGAGEEALEAEAPEAEEAAAEGKQGGAGSRASRSGHGSARVRLSGLRLASSTRAHLRRGRISSGQIAFSFRASRAATVSVWLVRDGTRAAGGRWRVRSSALHLHARRGLNRARLAGAVRLQPGAYTIELVAARGAKQTLLLHLG